MPPSRIPGTFPSYFQNAKSSSKKKAPTIAAITSALPRIPIMLIFEVKLCHFTPRVGDFDFNLVLNIGVHFVIIIHSRRNLREFRLFMVLKVLGDLVPCWGNRIAPNFPNL